MEFELIKSTEFSRGQVEIFAQVKRGGHIFIIGYDGDRIIEQEYNPAEINADLKPLLRIPYTMFKDVTLAFANLAKNEGLSTENENLLRGKMESMRYHLEDMRKFSDILLKSVTETESTSKTSKDD